MNRKKFSYDERAEVLKKSNNKCAHCGKELTQYDCTIEHMFPVSRGGGNEDDNIVALCEDCNKDKADNALFFSEYFNYIDNKYEKQMEINIQQYLGKINKDKIFHTDRTTFNALPYKIKKLAESIEKRSGRKKAREFKRSNLVKLHVREAVTSMMDDIVKFLDDNKQLAKISNCENLEPSKIKSDILNGMVYYVADKSDNIHGVIGFKPINSGIIRNLDIYEDLTNLRVKYIMSFLVLDRTSYSIFGELMDSMILGFVRAGFIPLYRNILGLSYSRKDKIASIPYAAVDIDDKSGTLDYFEINSLIEEIYDILYYTFIDTELTEDEKKLVKAICKRTVYGYKDDELNSLIDNEKEGIKNLIIKEDDRIPEFIRYMDIDVGINVTDIQREILQGSKDE